MFKLRKFLTILLIVTLAYPLIPILNFQNVEAASVITRFYGMVDGGSYQFSPLDVAAGEWVILNFMILNEMSSGVNLTGIEVTCSQPEGLDFAEDYGYTEVHRQNPDGSYTAHNVKVPTNKLVTTGLHLDDTDVEGFPSDFVLGEDYDVQVSYWSYVSLKSEETITVSCSYTSDQGYSDSQDYDINVHYCAPRPGDVIINEVNTSPQKDWSTNGFDSYFNRGDVNIDDEYIELYVESDGMLDIGFDLTNPNWQISVDNGSDGSVDFTGDLTAGSAFEAVSYFGAGSIDATEIGDYLLLGNPVGANQIADEVTINLTYSVSEINEVVFGGSGAPSGTSSGPLDEVVGRDAASTDTNNDAADFAKKHATPGRVNSDRVPNVYEAEIYTVSSSGNPKGVEINDATASGSRAVRLEASNDTSGEIYKVYTQEHTGIGNYRVTLTAKLSSISGTDHNAVGKFYVKYPNPLDRRTGHIITPVDFDLADTYRDFSIEIRKPDTVGLNNEYEVLFEPLSGYDLILDKIEVITFTPWHAVDCPMGTCTYESEKYYSKVGTKVNDAAASDGRAYRTLSTEVSDPTHQHILYGPYGAAFIDGTVNNLNALFDLKFENITASNPEESLAQLEVYNNYTLKMNILEVRLGDVLPGTYQTFIVPFAVETHGSYQFRIISWANSDVYADRVRVALDLDSVVYQSEDYYHPNYNGEFGEVVADTLAANGWALRVVPGDGSGWAQGYRPYYTDYIGEDTYLKATFSIRTDTLPTDMRAVNIMVYSHLPSEKKLVTFKTIFGDFLSQSEYRDFEVYFKAPPSGYVSYRVWYFGQTNVLLDQVRVERITMANPITYESEYYCREIVERVQDPLARPNAEVGNERWTTYGPAGADLWFSYGGPYQYMPTGNYSIRYYLRKDAIGGNPAINIVMLEVRRASDFSLLEQRYLREDELTSTYQSFTLPTFNLSSEDRFLVRIKYLGSSTSYDLYFDRFEIERIGGF